MTKERQTKIYACNSEVATSCYILQFIIDTALQISGGFEMGNILQNVDSTCKVTITLFRINFPFIKNVIANLQVSVCFMRLLTFQPSGIGQEKSQFFPVSLTGNKQKSPFYFIKTFISSINILMGEGDTYVICLRKILDFLNQGRKMSLCVLPVAFKTQPATYPANPVLLVFTIVQTSINLTGFIVFILLEEKK